MVNFLSAASLLLAWSSASNAFLCTQPSKTSFKYYYRNDCGINTRDSSFRNQQLLQDGRAYSSSNHSRSRRSVSSVDNMGSPSASDSPYSAKSQVRNVARGVSDIWGVLSDVLVKGDELTKEEARPTTDRVEMEEDECVLSYDADGEPSLSQAPSGITLVDTNWLKDHERIVSAERVEQLHDAIVGWDAYRLPLLVDSRSGAILDGHHRYAVGLRLGLARLPVVLVDYLHDDSITVAAWPGCGYDGLTKEDVIAMSLSDAVYPPKTSKHDFLDSVCINVPLDELK